MIKAVLQNAVQARFFPIRLEHTPSDRDSLRSTIDQQMVIKGAAKHQYVKVRKFNTSGDMAFMHDPCNETLSGPVFVDNSL